ncbi:MAG: transcription elongation factor NusA, partial [Microbacteriaceae bacterium]|nr:transcription elongation factor NusA [Microbacteriaceae bacterium]
MDIDLSVLKLMESEREIPFDELVVIIEQAILVAYEKHTGQADHRGMRENPDAPRARVEIDKKTGHVVVYIPIVNEEG